MHGRFLGTGWFTKIVPERALCGPIRTRRKSSLFLSGRQVPFGDTVFGTTLGRGALCSKSRRSGSSRPGEAVRDIAPALKVANGTV